MSDQRQELTTQLANETTNLPAWMQGIHGNLDQALSAGEIILKSGFAPKGYNNPQSVVVACAMGARLGLDPFSAMAGIAVVNGRPTLYGDAMLAVCQNSPKWDGMAVNWEGEKEEVTCLVTIKRKGVDPYTGQFSIKEAKGAGLWNKQGPWSNHPRRMLEMRARAYALRGQFADVLSGFACREELEDLREVESEVVATDPAPAIRRSVGHMPDSDHGRQAVHPDDDSYSQQDEDQEQQEQAEPEQEAAPPKPTLDQVVAKAIKDLGGQKQATAVLKPIALKHGIQKFTEAPEWSHGDLIKEIENAVAEVALGGAK